jgi:hypothetical protein
LTFCLPKLAECSFARTACILAHGDGISSQFAGGILAGVEEDEETLQILARKIGVGS